ncbi:phage terminase large subunit [Robiginitalea biformata]|uniref:Terminase large subunit n=1 Tax=Robiginitalea biformata (strain ATCC BAA-864 / DSM 15991 / KCTC 12146 / HTCC2501) TaxID=313596 RepID=A4CPV0_ROBBH|nr:phage terminase large subunit [Robiginitalea biformata]EAR14035.1 terminase large subunit [Robiginitalea biformata HTCC2501]
MQTSLEHKLRRYRQLKARLKILELHESLADPGPDTSPNYKLLHDALNSQDWGYNEKGQPYLKSGYAGVVLEGSSRSRKTWSGIDFIIWLATDHHKEDGCTINIYRETYNEFKTTLYDDFKRRLDDFDLPNPFHDAKEVKSFKIGKSRIFFLGDGKHGGGCDYAFFNEIMMQRREVFDQVEMRCRIFWWCDYNPSFTDHWVFDSVVPRSDTAFLRTTFKDNPFISPSELNKILSYEPWEPGTYQVTEEGVFYKGKPITETNQPPPHIRNVEQGTADEFNWKVYGLGLRGAMKGTIFPNITWIDAFPNMDYIYANDFGFTADPNALVRYSEDANNIYIEPLIYKPIETPDELAAAFEALGVEKRKPIPCDSSDKYTGENKGTVEMVQGLQDRGYRNAFKVSKKKGIMFWILSMKKKKIHVVKNHLFKEVKKEQENYKFKEVNGILINQPIDGYDHIFTAGRYGHMAWNDRPRKALGSQARGRV